MYPDIKSNTFKSNSIPFYALVIGLFLIITSPALFSDGMFMDGLIYSTVAHNLSNGLGSFWNLHFTYTCHSNFHEHPPLAFGIQGLFYTVLGDIRFVDKFYSLLTYFFVGWIITKIWSQLKYNHPWIPLLFWIITPLVSWACSNNMLENTLSIFTCLAVLFYLLSQEQKKYLYIFLSGFVLSLGFLTKGFVVFYPLIFPCLLWLTSRNKSFREMTAESAFLLFFTVAPLVLLIILFPDARHSLKQYLEIQVINSIKNTSTVDSRFYIVYRMLLELLPSLGLAALLAFWGWCKKISLLTIKNNTKPALIFILLALSGVLPIMISMKQRGFYILTTFPFFAIGIGILIHPIIESLINQTYPKLKENLLFKCFSYGLLITGVSLSIYFSQGIGRDKNKIQDTDKILTQLSQGSIVSIHSNLAEDWSLHGYFARRKNVSLDANSENKRDFLILGKSDYSETYNQEFELKDLQTVDLILLQRKKWN